MSSDHSDLHIGPEDFPESVRVGDYELDHVDLLLIAMLKDEVLSPEFCWRDPNNIEYGGCYRVRDYQVKFNRVKDSYAGFACARSVGKTERQKVIGFSHFFRRYGDNLLITAPELLHLLPLADAIEDRIESCRLLRECLKKDKAGKTGFSHNPFGVDYADGTKIVGRIPNKDGRGVKGQHQYDLMIEEAQDFPDAGWVEVAESLSLDQIVVTPSGHVKMRDIHPGDFVIGSDGNQTMVIGESPVRKSDIYSVRFSDGTEVECDGDHLWTVAPRQERTFRDMSTLEIKNSGKKWFVPELCSPADFPESDLTIDPYILGLLLGDGGLGYSTVRYSTADDQLVNSISEYVSPSAVIKKSKYDYTIIKPGGMNCHLKTKLRYDLDNLGIRCRSEDKFIPDQYLFSSIDQRLAILQGLCDTDGHAMKNGLAVFSSSSKKLSNGVEFIVRSLGGKCWTRVYVDKRGYMDSHVVRFRLNHGMNPFRLKRKADKYRATSMRYARKIESVEKIGVGEVKCIMVDNSDGLFALEKFILTHNTVMKDKDDFRFHFYGVHRGARGGGFSRRTQGGMFNIHSLTAIQRPGWGKEEKQAAIETYGGTSSPDYRRNILGEPGAASSPIFVTARLMSAIDQQRDSRYNTTEYVHQHLRWEDYKNMGLDVAHVIDLPGKKYDNCIVGIDLGLTNSPTVVSIFGKIKFKGQDRLGLIRRLTLERFTSPQLRKVIKMICDWNPDLVGIGIDITGLGFPIFQELQEGEGMPPPDVLAKVKGWKFNEKIPTYSANYKGNEPQEPVMMSVVEATTRYLREWVDSGKLLLPFDTEITADLLAENIQRVESLSRLTGSKKPNAFHILDSFRMAALVEKMSTESEHMYERQPVYDIAIGDIF